MYMSLSSLAVNISFNNRRLKDYRWKPFDKILEYSNCNEWFKCFFVQKFFEKLKSCTPFHAVKFIEHWLDKDHVEFSQKSYGISLCRILVLNEYSNSKEICKFCKH